MSLFTDPNEGPPTFTDRLVVGALWLAVLGFCAALAWAELRG